MIELNNVYKKFDEIIALDNVSTKINRGVTGIIGPNGSGKTTLVQLILGLLRPTSGNISVMGIDSSDRDNLIELTGYIPEKTAVYGKMTAREYLDFFARLKGLEIDAEDVLARYEILERADDYITTFSKGMKRRLELARVCLNGPEILIMDEPFTGLDPSSRVKVREDIKKAKNVIICSHNLHEVQLVSREIVMLRSGNLLLHEKTNKFMERTSSVKVSIRGVFDENAGKIVEEFASEVIEIKRNSITLLSTNQNSLPNLIRKLSSNYEVYEVIPEVNLEKVFMELTG